MLVPHACRLTIHPSRNARRGRQVVNGPEVLSKYVGQAEENIRNLFGEAEAEYKEKGDSSVRGAGRGWGEGAPCLGAAGRLPFGGVQQGWRRGAASPACCHASLAQPGRAWPFPLLRALTRSHPLAALAPSRCTPPSYPQELHIIIFDEIDAICKTRGTVRDGTATHDTIVNQLLTKIDGVDALNNILLIGMTNRCAAAAPVVMVMAGCDGDGDDGIQEWPAAARRLGGRRSVLLCYRALLAAPRAAGHASLAPAVRSTTAVRF